MEIMAIVKLFPVVLTVVEVVKRFLPDRTRTYANPIIAVVTGLVGAYTVGGQTEAMDALMTGLLSAAAAIGAYKIPKVMAAEMGIQ